MGDATIAFNLKSRSTGAGSMYDSMANRPGTPGSDEQLMLAFSQGAAEAFDELFSRYRRPIFGFFWRRVADAGRAEELTQDTFTAVIRASAHYRADALFRTYLYAIAFKVLRAYRRRAAFRATFLGESPSHHDPPAQGDFETGAMVRDAVKKLDPVDREILLLREFEQLAYAEISVLLALPLNTVRSRLFRARTALRNLLASPEPGSAPGKQEERR